MIPGYKLILVLKLQLVLNYKLDMELVLGTTAVLIKMSNVVFFVDSYKVYKYGSFDGCKNYHQDYNSDLLMRFMDKFS